LVRQTIRFTWQKYIPLYKELFPALSTRFSNGFGGGEAAAETIGKSSDMPLNGKFVLRNIDYYFS